ETFREIVLPGLWDYMIGHAHREKLVPIKTDLELIRAFRGARHIHRDYIAILESQEAIHIKGHDKEGAISLLQKSLERFRETDSVYAASSERQLALCLGDVERLDDAVDAARRAVKFADEEPP